VLWGAYKHPEAGETWSSAITDLEAQAGRTFDIVYRYHDFSGVGTNGAFPDKFEQQLAASGHILMDDWQSVVYSPKATISWASIASGAYDASVIEPEAERIKAFGQPMFLAFDHEMDSMVGSSGTAAQYVAAYRHIHDVFTRLGVTNVIWIWTITGYGAHDAMFTSLYPGNSYVDWIGYDPYNFASCHGTAWKSFDQTIDPTYQWLEANGFGDKPFMLPEYGTVSDSSNPSASADWYTQIPATLSSHPNIKGLLAWDDSSGSCDTQLTVSPGEFQGFADSGRSPSIVIGG
jgi:Glycosyl hydrolase family 26